MGETTDQLRKEIDAKRHDASEKIEQIEQKVSGTADQVRGQVDQVRHEAEHVRDHIKETFNWRKQVEEKPLVAIGAAFMGGMVLGGVLGGGDEHQQHQPSNRGYAASYNAEHGMSGGTSGQGIKGTLRHAAKSSGLEDQINSMATGMMGMLSTRLKDVADKNFPQMADKVAGKVDEASKKAQSKIDETMSSSKSSSSSGSSQSRTASTATAPSDYTRTGELGSTTSSS